MMKKCFGLITVFLLLGCMRICRAVVSAGRFAGRCQLGKSLQDAKRKSDNTAGYNAGQ